mmetsp:Transcript_37695/g.78207  ORF Transcript_37695/g.78207 Transcript_37695/m.78207 type:complete len:208 (+) Transcript_37695:404-1027(+)
MKCIVVGSCWDTNNSWPSCKIVKIGKCNFYLVRPVVPSINYGINMRMGYPMRNDNMLKIVNCWSDMSLVYLRQNFPTPYPWPNKNGRVKHSWNALVPNTITPCGPIKRNRDMSAIIKSWRAVVVPWAEEASIKRVVWANHHDLRRTWNLINKPREPVDSCVCYGVRDIDNDNGGETIVDKRLPRGSVSHRINHEPRICVRSQDMCVH